jgi:hypothetical protein
MIYLTPRVAQTESSNEGGAFTLYHGTRTQLQIGSPLTSLFSKIVAGLPVNALY